MDRCLYVFLLKSHYNISPESFVGEKSQSILHLNDQFAEYALEFWPAHCILAQPEEVTSDMLKVFIDVSDGQSRAFVEWKRQVDNRCRVPKLSKYYDFDPPNLWKLCAKQSASTLFVACAYGLTAVVKALLPLGITNWNTPYQTKECSPTRIENATIDERPPYDKNYYPIEIAARRGFKDIVEMFLTNPCYAKGNPEQTIGTRSLYRAIEGHCLATANMLLEYGVDTEIFVDGNTCLHKSCCSDQDLMVQLLLKYHIDVNLPDHRGYTSLEAAMVFGAIGNAKLLIDNGAELPKIPERFIICVAQCGDIPLLEAIRAKLGVDLTGRYSDGLTLMHMAVRSNCPGRLDVIKFLSKNGLDIQSVTDGGDTLLHAAMRAVTYLRASTRLELLSIISFLLDEGVPINALNSHGRTAFDELESLFTPPYLPHIYPSKPDRSIVKLLLARGASPPGRLTNEDYYEESDEVSNRTAMSSTVSS